MTRPETCPTLGSDGIPRPRRFQGGCEPPETLRDYLMQSRLAELQEFELYLTTPLETLFQDAPDQLY